jgi:hypothetical protein
MSVVGIFIFPGESMTHAKSLRVIGQTLEVARVFVFNLESDGRNYVIQSDSMSRTAEWILRYAASESDYSTVRQSKASAPVGLKPVVFSNEDLARRNAREAKRRRELTPRAEPSTKLSHLLRTLGDHLDRSSARTFHIFWTPESVVVDYRRSDGLTDRHRFTLARLSQIGNSEFAERSAG